MKTATLVLAILTLSMLLTVWIPANLREVKANEDYVIDHVDQSLHIMYNGYILMNDTVHLSGQGPNSFMIGFPYKFGSSILRCQAFETNNESNTFPVNLNEPFEGRSGYYGINISFSGKVPQTFSVQTLFSNSLISQDAQNASVYTLTFPAFPSLLRNANSCNGSVVLPTNAKYIKGTIANTTYNQYNMTAFTLDSSNVIFFVGNYEMQIFDVNPMNREIKVNEFGEITGSDYYHVTNKAVFSIDSTQVLLPIGAFDVNAEDQLGRTMVKPTEVAANTSRYTLKLTRPLDRSTTFIVHYSLPSNAYVRKQGASNDFAMNMTLFKDLDYYVNETSISFILPEGARLQTVGSTLMDGSYNVKKDVFQEKLTIDKIGVTWLDSFNAELAYEYNPIWIAFRPTIWAIFLSMIGCIAAVIIRRPRAAVALAAVPAGIQLRPESLRSFVSMYEEKMKVITEIGVLENRAKKGKIQRQRYKVQRKTLETRLETSTRNLGDLKEKIRSAGGHYANLIRELEIAETELDEVGAHVRSIETRHSRGELSLEAYRKLLSDYERTRERAQTSVNGILLRLREEIR